MEQPSDQDIKERWDKKKDSIHTLASNIGSLKRQVNKDLDSEKEKDFLTALVIKIMLTTLERVGNEESASENGHYGVTGFTKKHISLKGNSITFNYRGKSGVDHEKTVTSEKISSGLRRAIDNSPSKQVFTTSKDFQIKADRINRYLSDYGVTSKDIRGYLSNEHVLSYLGRIEAGKEEKHRVKQFNEVVKKVAKKTGHTPATLNSHYLVPEIKTSFIEKSKIEGLDLNTYEQGGALSDSPIVEPMYMRDTFLDNQSLADPLTLRFSSDWRPTNKQDSSLEYFHIKKPLYVQIFVFPTVISVTKYFGSDYEISNEFTDMDSALKEAERLMEAEDLDVETAEYVDYANLAEKVMVRTTVDGKLYGIPTTAKANPLPLASPSQRKELLSIEGFDSNSLSFPEGYALEQELPPDQPIFTFQWYVLPEKSDRVKHRRRFPSLDDFEHNEKNRPLLVVYNGIWYLLDGNHRVIDNRENNYTPLTVLVVKLPIDLTQNPPSKPQNTDVRKYIGVQLFNPTTSVYAKRRVEVSDEVYNTLMDIHVSNTPLDPFGMVFGGIQHKVVNEINKGFHHPYNLIPEGWVFKALTNTDDFSKDVDISMYIERQSWENKKINLEIQREKTEKFIEVILNHQVVIGSLTKKEREDIDQALPQGSVFKFIDPSPEHPTPALDFGSIKLSFDLNQKLKIPHKKRIISSTDIAKKYLLELADCMGWNPDSNKPTIPKPPLVRHVINQDVMNDGGIVEGKAHSECDEDGCGEKFTVDDVRVVELEEDEPVLTQEAMTDPDSYIIEGTVAQITSAINVIGEGKSWEIGARVTPLSGSALDPYKFDKSGILIHKDKDVVVGRELENHQVVINKTSYRSKTYYKCEGTLIQIASLLNEQGGGVKIAEGGSIKEIPSET